MVRTAQPQQAIRLGLHDSLLARLATSLQTQHRRLGGTLLRVGKVGSVGGGSEEAEQREHIPCIMKPQDIMHTSLIDHYFE